MRVFNWLYFMRGQAARLAGADWLRGARSSFQDKRALVPAKACAQTVAREPYVGEAKSNSSSTLYKDA